MDYLAFTNSYKKYGITWNSSYTDEFMCIVSSDVSESYMFYMICHTNFSIFHHGRVGIEKRIILRKHQNAVQTVKNNKKVDFFSEKIDMSVIHAE